MNFDDLKVIWDDAKSRPSFTIDEEALNRAIVKRTRSFRNVILRRDVLEMGVAGLLALYFLYLGINNTVKHGGEITLFGISAFLLVVGVAFVGLFLFIGRRRQKRRETKFKTSVRGNLRKLLSHVSYQIKILDDVFWWYLFPLIPGGTLFIIATAQTAPLNPWIRGLICILLFGFVLWFNKRGVRVWLIPQKRELESLLSRLEEHEE